jgi:ATP-dependent RNA circularization protein (DNA/RNA ligase family)
LFKKKQDYFIRYPHFNIENAPYIVIEENLQYYLFDINSNRVESEIPVEGNVKIIGTDEINKMMIGIDSK